MPYILLTVAELSAGDPPTYTLHAETDLPSTDLVEKILREAVSAFDGKVGLEVSDFPEDDE
jgi:hypothetical protein